jgi:pyruvate dehydrogenase E2 component (dihydrolipoamide acetyltransferase)
VPIGGLIAVLGKEGEDVSGILAQYGGDGAAAQADAPPAEAPAASGDGSSAPAPQPAAAPPAPVGAPRAAPSEAPAAASESAAAPGGDAGRVKASPLARRMATEHGLELGGVRGSGPEGRIVRRDVEAAMQQPAPQAQAPQGVPQAAGDGYRAQPISQMRKAIARRLSQSKFTAPHFYLQVDVDMEEAATFRERLNALSEKQGTAKVSFNDLITKACGVALRQHPYVNASWVEEAGELRFHARAHVAVAVAIEEGLITPVVRDADQKGLARIAAETRDLATRARDKKLQPEEYEGSTFTTSNLGMFGIEGFTAIINPPNSCILAIGAIRDEPVVKDGAVVPGKRMKLTLSCDHRVVDGAAGAAFLTAVKGYLEQPLTMLL